MVASEGPSGSDGTLRGARLATAVAMAGAPLTTLFLPGIGLWSEPSALRTGLGAAGLGAVAATQAAVLYAAVTPWLSEPTRRRLRVAFVTAAVVSVPLVAPVGSGEWATWAWLGGSIAGTVPMVLRRWSAVLAVLVCFAATVGVAWWTGGSAGRAAGITMSIGLTVAATIGLPGWLWRTLVQVQQGRAAQSRLVATEERLRFARDVHDLLGHHLSVIAMEAELAARLAVREPERAAEHASVAQRLAVRALAETRSAVHGYRAMDLADQLDAVAQVLRSSGVRCTVDVSTEDVPADVASQLAAVLREASTNLLRHSRASWCTIGIDLHDRAVVLTVVNDGVGSSGPDPHSYGLRGLAERLGEMGGSLRTHRGDGVFTLEASAPVAAP